MAERDKGKIAIDNPFAKCTTLTIMVFCKSLTIPAEGDGRVCGETLPVLLEELKELEDEDEEEAGDAANIFGAVDGRKREGGRFRLSSASGFKLHREAAGRGQCPSQKGSGAEAVCLE
ncbi:hypothetical protein B0H14DRAFT_2582757 [Mycena olivaceomarginata]|nr:hypothetical protein B0H14DRAFT_2582757 [Mycena olivaceomarginata]